jgi:hypothetical protein
MSASEQIGEGVLTPSPFEVDEVEVVEAEGGIPKSS